MRTFGTTVPTVVPVELLVGSAGVLCGGIAIILILGHGGAQVAGRQVAGWLL